MIMDFERIKLFYLETWWLWAIYLIACFAATYFISIIFLSALPMLLAISLYFAIIRGPSGGGVEDDQHEADDSASDP